MKFFPSLRNAAVSTPAGTSAGTPAAEIDRRSLVVGAGVAGAAALAAAALHRGSVAPQVAAAAKPKAEAGDGYQVTPHVLRYYETTRS